MILLAVAAAAFAPGAHAADRHPPVELFIDAASMDEQKAARALAALDEWWRDDYACILVDIARFMEPRQGARARPRRRDRPPEGSGGFGGLGGTASGSPDDSWDAGPGVGVPKGGGLPTIEPLPQRHPSTKVRERLVRFLGEQTGQTFGDDLGAWRRWYWNLPFGLEAGGEARAYPQRILGRHELIRDQLGETHLAIVTDLLCGTVIPYVSETHGSRLSFKPSGLVYRSNRLIFDEETASLWSTIEGRPVFGPLTLHDVELRAFPVVTARWGDWKALHPDTTVLSLDTGYSLDYSRENLFRRYLRSDRLVFDVPQRDDRLKTKEPVLGLILREAGNPEASERRALAIQAKFLEKKQNRVYHKSFAGRELVVVTSRDGANRVYDAGETRFVAHDREGRLRDASGGYWSLSEAALIPEATDASPKTRLAARRVFWFAWQAQFPDTELVR